MKFLVPIDLVQNELQNAVIQNLTTNPTNAKAGQVYFNTTENTLYQYKGTTDGWKPVGTVYELPIASATTLGGIKVGYGLAIDNDGVLKVTGGGTADAVEWKNVLNTPTTLNGYGIVDAKIDNGTITLNTDTITPITSINNKTGSSIILTASDVDALPSSTTYVSTVDGSSGAITTNAVKYTTQSLTDAQKVQARTNIGAGTSSFSGSYTDLTNKPTIDTILSDTSTNAVTNKAIKAALDTKYDSTNQPPYPVTSVNGNTGDITLNDVKYVAQTLTDTQKAQVRTNIGAGTSSFSGSYKDLTDTPTIDTAMSATSTNAVQNKVIKSYVDNIIAVSQGIVYKGVINSTADIPTTYEVGWLYMIATAGTYVGQTCEIGDLMIAVVARKGSGNVNSDWDIIQTNIDGAITSISGSDPIDVTGSSSSKTVSLKTSGVTANAYGDTNNQTPAFGGTFKVPSFTVDTYGRLTVAGSHTVTIPSTVASGTTNGLMVSADYTLLHGLDTRVGTLETKVSTLEGRVITYGTTKIASTQTSVSVDIPSGKSITSVICRSGSNNESIIADWKHDTTANTLTVSIASTVTYDINVIYTYM